MNDHKLGRFFGAAVCLCVCLCGLNFYQFKLNHDRVEDIKILNARLDESRHMVDAERQRIRTLVAERESLEASK